LSQINGVIFAEPSMFGVPVLQSVLQQPAAAVMRKRVST